MANKPYVPVNVVKDDFKYWEYVWPRISVPFDIQWLHHQTSTYEVKMAEEYAFLCHHHDKCYQYRDLWEERGVPWRHAVMVYMLSFSQYKGERCHVGEWVAQYANEIIEELKIVAYSERQLEAQFLKDDLENYQKDLLHMASTWINQGRRGTPGIIFSKSYVHTGHNAIAKMQFATRIARTLVGVSVSHCWRHSHGDVRVGDKDFITSFLFPKWDAE